MFSAVYKFWFLLCMKQTAEQVRLPPVIGGRGAVFARMQQAQEMSVAAEQVLGSQPPPVIGGRGAIFQRIQQASVHSDQPQAPVPGGRGKVLEMIQYVLLE